MPKLIQIIESAAPAAQNATAILAEAEAVETIIIGLEPGAKALLVAEWAKVKAAASTIIAAAASFESASLIGKATQAFSLLSAVLSIGAVLQGIWTDGQKFFGASWPQVQVHIAAIQSLVFGTAAPASA